MPAYDSPSAVALFLTWSRWTVINLRRLRAASLFSNDRRCATTMGSLSESPMLVRVASK